MNDEKKEALVDELEGLRGKLRRADKHYAVMCRAVEQLEGELKAQGDQHAVDKINSENRCKKLQQQVQGLAGPQSHPLIHPSSIPVNVHSFSPINDVLHRCKG